MSTTARPVSTVLTTYDKWLRALPLPQLEEWGTGVKARMLVHGMLPSGLETITPALFVALVADRAQWLAKYPLECLFLPETDDQCFRVYALNAHFAEIAFKEAGYKDSDCIDDQHKTGLKADSAVIKMARQQVETLIKKLPELEDLLSKI